MEALFTTTEKACTNEPERWFDSVRSSLQRAPEVHLDEPLKSVGVLSRWGTDVAEANLSG